MSRASRLPASRRHRRSGRFRSAPPQEILFASVACQHRCCFQGCACFLVAAELVQQVAADTSEQVICFERGIVHQAIGDRQSRFRAVRHANCDGAVELNDRRAHQRRELGIKS